MEAISELAERIIALQELTETSKTITSRAQGKILQSLSDEDLVAVAREVAHRRRLSSILMGVQHGA